MIKKPSTPESQLRAVLKYDKEHPEQLRERQARYKENNKEQYKISQYKSYAKSFVRKYSTMETLAELQKVMDKRKKELKS